MVGVPFKVCLPGGQTVGVVAYNFVHLHEVLKFKFGLGGALNFSLDDGTLVCDQDYFELLPPQTKLTVTEREIPADYGFPNHTATPPHLEHVAADLQITSVAGNVSMNSPPRPQLVCPSSNYITSPRYISPEQHHAPVSYQHGYIHRQNYHQIHLQRLARLQQRNVVVRQRHQIQQPMHIVRPIEPPVPPQTGRPTHPYRTQCRFETPQFPEAHLIHVRRELNQLSSSSPPSLQRLESLSPPRNHLPAVSATNVAPPVVSTPAPRPSSHRHLSPPNLHLSTTAHVHSPVSTDHRLPTPVKERKTPPLSNDNQMVAERLSLVKPSVIKTVYSPPIQPPEIVNATPKAVELVKSEESEDEGELYIDETASSPTLTVPESPTAVTNNVKCSTALELAVTVEASTNTEDCRTTDVPLHSANDSAAVASPLNNDMIGRLPFADFDVKDLTPNNEPVEENVKFMLQI